MSYMLPHLHTGYAVDRAIMEVSGQQVTRESACAHQKAVCSCHPQQGRMPVSSARKAVSKATCVLQEEDRVVIVRFGHDADPICMQMDETLANVADPIKNFAVIYLVDITAVCRLPHARCARVPHHTHVPGSQHCRLANR